MPSDAVSLGGEKIPTDFDFLCASFRWLGVLFEKKIRRKGAVSIRTSPKSEIFIRSSKMDPEGAILGLFLQNSAYGFLRCMHSSFIGRLTQFYVKVVRQRAIFAQICSNFFKLTRIRHLRGYSGVLQCTASLADPFFCACSVKQITDDTTTFNLEHDHYNNFIYNSNYIHSSLNHYSLCLFCSMKLVVCS